MGLKRVKFISLVRTFNRSISNILDPASLILILLSLIKKNLYQYRLTNLIMLVFENKISSINYDEKHKLITYTEHGISKKELIIDQLKAVIEFSESNSITGIIADFRNLQGSFKNTFEFLNTKYYPIMKARGLICKAFVVTEDIINNHLANNLIDTLAYHSIKASLFSDTQKAHNWVIKTTT